jgi:hypothetical protein
VNELPALFECVVRRSLCGQASIASCCATGFATGREFPCTLQHVASTPAMSSRRRLLSRESQAWLVVFQLLLIRFTALALAVKRAEMPPKSARQSSSNATAVSIPQHQFPPSSTTSATTTWSQTFGSFIHAWMRQRTEQLPFGGPPVSPVYPRSWGVALTWCARRQLTHGLPTQP